MKKSLAIMLALIMTLMLVPTAAFAEGKSLTVAANADERVGVTYKTIQGAIKYIAEQTDKDGWKITVKNGTYDRFTVPFGMSNLTIEGESPSGVVVNVLKDDKRDGDWDNGGINVHGGNITLKNMTVSAGPSTKAWCDAAISTHHGAIGGKGVSLTVENCIVSGNNSKYGIFWDCDRVEVKNCTISGFSNAIEIMGDNYSIPNEMTYEMTGNTITGCSFAIHGYLGGGDGGGTLKISNNRINGTDALCAKVIAQQNGQDNMKVDVSGNTMENTVIGLVNLKGEGETISDPLKANTLGKNCFYVEAIEPGTIKFYSTYHAPSGDNGYWKLTDIDDLEVDWGGNPKGAKAAVQKLIDEANKKGSHDLSITSIEEGELIKTFTWFKDAIYWVSAEEPSPTPTPTSKPYTPHYHTDPTPVPPIIVNPPKTGDMTIWQSILSFFGIM